MYLKDFNLRDAITPNLGPYDRWNHWFIILDLLTHQGSQYPKDSLFHKFTSQCKIALLVITVLLGLLIVGPCEDDPWVVNDTFYHNVKNHTKLLCFK